MGDITKILTRSPLSAGIGYAAILVIGLQILITILTYIFPSLKTIKFGWAILALTIVVGLVMIERIFSGEFKVTKEHFWSYMIAIGAILLIWFAVPQALPQLFSTARSEVFGLFGLI